MNGINKQIARGKQLALLLFNCKLLKSFFEIFMTNIRLFGIKIDYLSQTEVIEKIVKAIKEKKKLWIVTPNPEFLIAGQKNQRFVATLNQADISIPDGIGLVWASKILKTKPGLSERITGSDLAEQLLLLASDSGWKVGIVGVRRGNITETEILIKKLKEKYPKLEIEPLGEFWQKENYNLIFACHGMVKQEEWIRGNMSQVKSGVFIGAGGSLDFLAGFSKRAPFWVRNLGLEWLWRLILEPWRVRRQLNLIKFVWLMARKELKD